MTLSRKNFLVTLILSMEDSFVGGLEGAERQSQETFQRQNEELISRSLKYSIPLLELCQNIYQFCYSKSRL
jgi:hypothetical protein